MERKFTDNEIVKALECCSKKTLLDDFCDVCPNLAMGSKCMDNMLSDALDLIHRQKAQIERYEKTVGKLAVSKDGIVTGMLNGKETEYIQKSVADVFRNMAVNRAKTEAIKEFAERLKEKLQLNRVVMGCNCAIVEAVQIDSLVKEMTGENNGN
jgi:hypothetical protein